MLIASYAKSTAIPTAGDRVAYPWDTAARASLSYFSTKLERTRLNGSWSSRTAGSWARAATKISLPVIQRTIGSTSASGRQRVSSGQNRGRDIAPFWRGYRKLMTTERDSERQYRDFEFNLRELAGSMGDFGTLFPLAIGFIAVNGMGPAGLFIVMGLANIALGSSSAAPLPTSSLLSRWR